MSFISLIFKNLLRRKFRTLLTLSALVTAVAAVVSLLGMSKGFTKSFADVYAAHSVDIVVSRQGTTDRLSSSVDHGYVARIETVENVARAAGVLLDTLSIEDRGVFGIPTMGIDPASWLLQDYRLRAGKIMSTDQLQSVLLGVHLADRLQVAAGEALFLFEERYHVAGVFESSSTWENGSMILPLTQLQNLTDRHEQVTYVNVVLEHPINVEVARAAVLEIESIDPKLLALTTDEFVNTDTRMQLAGAMAWVTSMIALLIGAIGTLNTMMTSVLERTREIGILRAIGWPRRRIVGMILAESCGLAMLASLLGGLLAIVGTWALSQTPVAKGVLSPSIDAIVLAEGAALAIGIGVIGALLPAWRAAQLQPTEAFRDV